ncbi:MAG TPA: pyridoxal-dependent decarboxylase [Acidimicrobiia bacterium]|nr:pyridoxal-dependent decarboxylase [Acidimicrobiia bacterium]
MTPDEFRRVGHDLVEWVARYMEQVESFPVLSPVEPGWVRAQLPVSPPGQGESWEAIAADLDRVVLPGLTHWQSPNFFAYFPANASGPSILGELVSAGLGVQGMLWATSPACTEIETLVLDWVLEMLGLPDRFRSTGAGGGVIQDSASSATLCALLAARHRVGAAGDLSRLVAYASREAHSSVEKAVRIAGLSPGQLRSVTTAPHGGMDPAALATALDADAEAGLVPFFVVATSGTTSSLAFDPLPAVADVAARHGAWLHVDAAMAGAAAVCEEFRFVVDGVERADSWCFNPHKWLFTNFDCDCFYVADRAPLIEALSILPEYLRNQASESGQVIDYRDWQVPLGRRFRALKLWFVIRHYGTEGLAHHVRRHVELAQEVAGRVADHPKFELAAPSVLNLVCFRHVDGDEATTRVMEAANASGRVYLTHTRLDDRVVLRMAVGQTWTEQRHVDAAWDLLTALA